VTTSRDSTAKIWDAESGRVIHTLTGHVDDVYKAVFYPTFPNEPVGRSEKIVTASADQTAIIWDAESGTKINMLVHESEVRNAVFSYDGKMILTSDNYEAKIWDAESGIEIQLLTGEDYISSAVFSPDGKMILTTSLENTVKIWLTPEGIIDWLRRQKSICNLTNKDLKNLGIDFIDLEE